ncbi:hypothetical protein CLOBOL_00200 [Enterocloster bolteae ATCC BAA-613]|uniref:Uncharacterized protein n=1 Tax=Enterocloster bolteae (strain ATCC BAA-613 / DSM 15670 / CCUG 46953 / JCM 12243 / WAL 16351) TaxID=411902 RepID=A8RGR0_ENTBW|nr:hypothetical protein CLOBOL_00200 [Enterocloster bolteae ATCC BAA-613]
MSCFIRILPDYLSHYFTIFPKQISKENFLLKKTL